MDFLERAAGLIAEQADPGADFRSAWRAMARPEQIAPEGAWRTWYLRGGRGGGKTWAAAHTLAEWILADPEPGEWGIVAPTYQLAWSVCVEGESGFLAALGTSVQEVRDKRSKLVEHWHRSFAQIKLRSGHVVWVASAQDGGVGIQGKNLRAAWCDEIGMWDQWELTWNESLMYAVRKGTSRIIATGTPKKARRAKKLVKMLLDDPAVPVSAVKTLDNAANLSAGFLAEVVGKAKGTRLERQELEGVLLDDVEGALWTAENLDACRVAAAPELLRVVVAIDPAVSNEEGSDETGIVVVGEAEGGHGFVLGDYSMRGTPEQCMRKAVWAYQFHQADRVVGEANNGGDFIGSLLRTVDPMVAYRKVIATRGKRVRAEPVSALYEQCIAAGTLVVTDCGAVPIEQVRPGMRVWTREGLRSVQWAGCAGWRPTVVLTTADGHRLVCTEEHPVYVPARGFVRAAQLVPGADRLLAWPASVPIAVSRSPSQAGAAGPALLCGAGRSAASRSGRSWSTGASGITRTPPATGAAAATRATGCCTATSGKPNAGPFLTGGTFTTKTATPATTTSATSLLSRLTTTSAASMASMRPSRGRSLSACGTANFDGGLSASHLSMYAGSAAALSSPRRPASGSAPPPATRASGLISAAPGPVLPVYDLQIDRTPEFFAGGLLVHNCRMHHVGVLADLEEQMVNWVPSDPESPDRVDALVWGCAELTGLTGGSWLAAYGTKRCEDCENAYPDAYAACPKCNPGVKRQVPPEAEPSPQPMTGWGAAYGAARCPAGHTFIARRYKDCPRCQPGGGARGPMALPSLPGMARFR